MKKILAVLNIGGRCIHPKSRESFLHACKRWDCEFLEVKESLQRGVHHYWQKAFVINECGSNTRVLQLDADMLINSHCPSPFDLISHEQLGLVNARQIVRDGWIGGRDGSAREWARRLKVKPIRDDHHLNGGFFLYHTDVHADLFKDWRKVGRENKWCPRFLPEQASLSVMLQTTHKHVDVVWLPHIFNAVGAQQTERFDLLGPAMKAWIYHYTGGNKANRIANTWWNHNPSPKVGVRTQSLLNLLPKDQDLVGFEIGVLRGHNAAALLWNRPRLKMYLIDQWAPDPLLYKHDGNAAWQNPQWGMIFEEAMLNLKGVRDRCKVIQAPSVAAAKMFEEGSFDFGFIDANHEYGPVKQDLLAWKDKVTRFLSGHDWNVNNHVWGVTKAVKEVLGSGIKTMPGHVWVHRVDR